ncbi:MAG: class I SAM-dependent methyltransferase [Candidatus Limnocylindria bacterium]
MDDPKSVVRRGYDLVSRAYRDDNAEEGAYREWLDLIEQRVEPGARVLDLGCGCDVPATRRLARRYAVTGIDISPVQVTRARELVPEATFICADMTSLLLPDASFAAVACLYALIHVPLEKQPALLRSVHRWLRPGGLFLATVGHRAWTGLEKDWLGVEGGDMWWSHVDTETYRQWISQAGFKIEREAFIPEDASGHTVIFATS